MLHPLDFPLPLPSKRLQLPILAIAPNTHSDNFRYPEDYDWSECIKVDCINRYETTGEPKLDTAGSFFLSTRD